MRACHLVVVPVVFFSLSCCRGRDKGVMTIVVAAWLMAGSSVVRDRDVLDERLWEEQGTEYGDQAGECGR